MKLKEIKPGMVIHCKNDEEKKTLLEEAERLGYVWYGTKGKPTERSVYAIGDTIHFYDAGTTAFSADYKHITHSSCIGDPAIEFSDLIIPEMSAEEVLQICSEICRSGSCDICPMGEEYCFSETESDKKKIIEICQQWKSDHEKNEPEIEWAYRVEIEETKQYSDWITEELAIEQCEKLSIETGKNVTYRKVCRVKAVK